MTPESSKSPDQHPPQQHQPHQPAAPTHPRDLSYKHACHHNYQQESRCPLSPQPSHTHPPTPPPPPPAPPTPPPPPREHRRGPPPIRKKPRRPSKPRRGHITNRGILRSAIHQLNTRNNHVVVKLNPDRNGPNR